MSKPTVEEMARELAEDDSMPCPNMFKKCVAPNMEISREGDEYYTCFHCWLAFAYPAEIRAKYEEMMKQKGADNE